MKHDLDINTPKGQESLKYERQAINILEMKVGGSYVSTPKELPADVDYIKMDGDIMTAVLEVKCRNDAVSVFRGVWKNEWLITSEKIDKGKRAAIALQVPFWGVLYSIPDDTVLLQPIYCPIRKKMLTKERREVTDTQATVNGGEARRMNSFIDISKAKVVKPPWAQTNEEWWADHDSYSSLGRLRAAPHEQAPGHLARLLLHNGHGEH